MEKLKLEVYEPLMCCSSGCCGSNAIPELVRFSGDLEWLKLQNVDVIRYNASSNPRAFILQESVKEALEQEGIECLPMVLVNGYVASKGIYPTREELVTFLEIAANGSCAPVKNPGNDSQCCEGGSCC